ncbi:hypothetical protein FisN_5Hh344 [Fistulifera solaris]|uniref:Uncharacterized protein n=1 Tax=Fistulifera solaris TaxID=1519565 RepID=A0A1Z5JSW3_FISSO|nr:hypothetical protein FisN_5Hh344 [Fistulifera solaris]|eukprot:GAX16966.1 hypothetical protein FisN_5Hh344 [Fistulifera solaris]
MAYFSGDESVRYGDTDDDEEAATLDIEQTKRELRRMSLDLNAMGARRYGVNNVEISPREEKPKSILKNTRGLIESDDDTIIEEEVDDLDVTEIIEEDEEILEEVIEEVVDTSEVIEEIADEYEDDELQPDTIIEGDEDDEIEEEEEDEATEEEVREAIIYILKQEKPIDNGYLTSDQATRMMALPFKDMKEIMKHFELCDNAGEPIQWSVIADIVTPEDHGDEEEDLDDDEDCNEFCPVHGYSYCTECEVGLEPSTSSDDESEGDEVGSLGSGFDLQVPAKDKVDEGHISDISKLDLTDFDEVSD